MEPKRTCPECHLIFEAEPSPQDVVVCPLCNCLFSVHPQTSPIPQAAATQAPSAPSGRHVMRGALAVGVVLFLVGGIGYAYHLLDGIGPKANAVSALPASSPPVTESHQSDEIIPIVPAEPKPSAPIPPLLPWTEARQKFDEVIAKITESKPQLKPPLRPPLPNPPAFPKEASAPLRKPRAFPKEDPQPRTLRERVNRAIERGVAQLLARHAEHRQYCIYLGLLGLTLLECGVPADDPSVREIAAWVRSRERDLSQTYELALAILFLDRLGNSSDRALIRTFGQRLISGQFECGAWSYSCLGNNRRRANPNLPVIVPARPPPIVYHGDNSNTQFAILGLWVAQRYGVPARSALLAAERYFRTTQADDGSWSYSPNNRTSRDSMTCVGLLGMAMRYGVIAGQGRDIRPDHPIMVQDGAVTRGLRYLAQSLDKIVVPRNWIIGAEARDPLYFLWSLERMAVIYDLKKIGECEWYPWAAEMLVKSQGSDGRWAGAGDPVGTCFALLVLKRSNFAKDLQLTVQEQPAPEVSGPVILQGADVFLNRIDKPKPPPPPLGSSLTRTPPTK